MENKIYDFKKYKYKLHPKERIKDVCIKTALVLRYLFIYGLWIGVIIYSCKYSIYISRLELLGLISLVASSLVKLAVKNEYYEWNFLLRESVQTIVILAIIGWLIEITVK